MKKHDEGYTLPLVMVVLLVLSLVAVTIMTTSLHNMQRQQKFIEQMQAQYEAQGKIEQLVARLETLAEGTDFTTVTNNHGIEGLSVNSVTGQTVNVCVTHKPVKIDCQFTVKTVSGKTEIEYSEYTISSTEVKAGGAAG